MHEPFLSLSRRYLEAQIEGDRTRSVRLIVEEGLERGLAVPDLQLYVIQPAQYEIGRLWQENKLSIAQEHVATAISQLVMAHLYRYLPRHHINYLLEALRAKSPETLVRYARWLQSVLTSRGMCSRHLGDHFDRLAGAIVDQRIEEPEEALRLLADARDALVYEAGPAREISLAQEDIAQRAAEILSHRRGATPPAEAQTPPRAGDFDTLLSYLADAVALSNPPNFALHVRWLAGFLERRGVPRAELAERLLCLEEAIATLSPGSRELAGGVLASAQGALAEGSA